MKLQLKRSAVLDGGSAKEPTAAQVEYGELCVNYNEGDPALFIKNSLDQIIRIAGAGAVGDGETPGGPVLPDTGNKPGDVFFNTTNNSLYYWNGSEWVPIASQENAADIYVGTFAEVDAAIAVDDRANGLLLWETTEGQLYIWYIDADTKQWVQTVPASGSGGGGSSVSVLPTAPTVAEQGDLWYCTSDGRLYVYYDDNATSQWVDASPDDVAPVVHSGEIWPSNATENDLFFNTTDGRLYIYYNDGNSIQWVDASPDTQNYTDDWVRDDATGTLSPATDGDSVDIGSGNIQLNADGSVNAGYTTLGTQANGDGGVLIHAEDLDSWAAVSIQRTGTDFLSVRADGRFMLGGTQPTSPNITLSADGSASFAGSDFRIESDGLIRSDRTYSNTSGGTNDVGISSGGAFYRSTSSARFKSGVETIEDKYADAILNCRPVYYHSTCEMDDPALSYWGFIAEEVGEIDPRLVKWNELEDGTKQAEGVAYERFVPHLVNLLQRQSTRIETLEATNASLEARLTALEGGN
jgi:hypothetical protein